MTKRDAGSYTLDDEAVSAAGAPAQPGLVIVQLVESPACRVIPVGADGLELGRAEDDDADNRFRDPRMSRRHARISFDRRHGGGAWLVEDLESRNGTFVDGARVRGETRFTSPRILRVGSVLAVFTEDVQPFVAGVQVQGESIVGPRLGRSLDGIRRAAQVHDVLMVRGESGSGKELAARTFHAAGPLKSGPFVAVNCATVPHGVAERLLFGARKGAYSGAVADAEGYVEAAAGGVLFLDEIGELELEVQAKLLRFLETREFMPLGATRSRRVDVRVVFATHKNLRAAVAEGKFRADLYYRIGVLEASVPPLRERLEEIPWLIARAQSTLPEIASVHPSFVHACLLRPWPGNVRELLGAVRRAAYAAHLAGAKELRAEHLDADAGAIIAETTRRTVSSHETERAASTASSAPQPAGSLGPGGHSQPEGTDALRRRLEELERERIVDALSRSGGNQTEAAKLLGIARRTLINRMEHFQIPRPRKTGEEPRGE